MSTKNSDRPDTGSPVTPVSKMSRIYAARAARLKAYRKRLEGQQALAAGREMPLATSSEQIPSDGWPRWMTVATCAEYIDRTPWAIRGLMKQGVIPFLKQGGTIYFDRFVIDHWMQGMYRPAKRRRS